MARRVRAPAQTAARVRLWLAVSVVVALFLGIVLVSRGRRVVTRAAPCAAEMREEPAREARIRAIVATLPGKLASARERAGA